MDKANNPPSDGDENVSYFDCERDCEMEFVASACLCQCSVTEIRR